jgi:alanine racemase
MARPNRAGLDLKALRHNISHARALAPHSKIMAVVKANAYGHGAVTIAGTLEPHADAFAVACIEEALELRAAGIVLPILLLQGVFEESELLQAASHNFWVMIDNEWQLSSLEQAQLPNRVQCWLKIDTGMNRLGIDPAQTDDFYRRLKASPNADDSFVLCTHFAAADDLASDHTSKQIECFTDTCKALPAPRSVANSPGLLGWPESRLDWVRPGYMLYGNSPFGVQAHPAADALKPVMTLCSAVISLRNVQSGESVGYGASWTAQRHSLIATVTIGYGDGYPRGAKSGTPVLVNGQRAALAGRVSMDMITVDVTDLENVAIGDEVTLWGKDLPVAEVAQWADTIGYELTTRMPARTPRVVING